MFLPYSASDIVEEIFSEGCMHVQSDDEVIVNRCLEGDPSAFAFLVGKYKETVHAYAYHRVFDYQDAQDITQEVFIKAYRKLAQLKWPYRFQSWLYTIASNECNTWLRKHLKEREQEVHLEGGLHQGYAYTISAETESYEMDAHTHLHWDSSIDRHNWVWDFFWQGCFVRYADSKTSRGNI